MFGGRHPFEDIRQNVVNHLNYEPSHRKERTFRDGLRNRLSQNGYKVAVEYDPSRDLNIQPNYCRVDLEVQFGRRHPNVAIEAKENFGQHSREDIKRLRNEIQKYMEFWDYIIVCTNGFRNQDYQREWNNLRAEFETSGGMFSQQEIDFIPKPQLL